VWIADRQVCRPCGRRRLSAARKECAPIVNAESPPLRKAARLGRDTPRSHGRPTRASGISADCVRRRTQRRAHRPTASPPHSRPGPGGELRDGAGAITNVRPDPATAKRDRSNDRPTPNC
jgi:hypothetical protein